MSLPPLMASREAAIFARSGGCLNGLQRTSCPSMILLVSARRADEAVQHSNRGAPGSSYIPRTWSLIQTL